MTDIQALAQELGRLLLDKHISITAAESLTGGMISAAIVDVPGISACFHEGFVTYSDSAKERMLGVSAEIIGRFGAISAECAREMAKGAAEHARADIGISATGNAGPSADEGKQAGLVYIGVHTSQGTEAFPYQFQGIRRQIREAAAEAALKRAIEAAERF